MAKGKIITKFQQGRIDELQRHGLSQQAIANEIHCRTVIANFIKNPDAYPSKKSNFWPNKTSPSWDRH